MNPPTEYAHRWLLSHPSASNADVLAACNVSPTTLARLRRLTGLRLPRGRRKGSVPRNPGKIARAVLRHPERSGAELARELGISRQRVHTIRQRAASRQAQANGTSCPIWSIC